MRISDWSSDVCSSDLIYGGLMPTGWMRWIFDQHEFPFTIVYPRQLDAGKLRKDFDVVILPHAAFQIQAARASGDGMFRGRGDDKQAKPEELHADRKSGVEGKSGAGGRDAGGGRK